MAQPWNPNLQNSDWKAKLCFKLNAQIVTEVPIGDWKLNFKAQNKPK